MSDDNIVSLAYVSTASPSLSTDDLHKIGDSSVRNNAARGVTGLLGYNGTNFIQVLEGQRESVDQCVKIIETDTRHSGLIVINRRNIASREFPEWAMKVGHYGGANAGPDQGLDAALSGPNVSQETRNIFSSFRSLGNRV